MNTVAMQSERVTHHNKTYVVVMVQSESNPNKKYRVDVTNNRCNCPAWLFSRGHKPCKHLKSLGVTGDV